MSAARWAIGSLAVVAALALIVVLVAPMPDAPVGMPTRAEASGRDAWTSHLSTVDRAVDAKDINLAVRAWRDAYGEALGSRQWEPMLGVGQAALRIGHAAGAMAGFDAKARQCYLTALFRARQQNSLDGVLRVAEAFALLGDIEVATQAVGMAEALTRRARDDRQARERVAALRDRLHLRVSAARRSDFDPFPLLFPDEMTGP